MEGSSAEIQEQQAPHPLAVLSALFGALAIIGFLPIVKGGLFIKWSLPFITVVLAVLAFKAMKRADGKYGGSGYAKFGLWSGLITGLIHTPFIVTAFYLLYFS